MGTSNSNKGTRGSGTPLIPTWLEPANPAIQPPPPSQSPQEGQPVPPGALPPPPIPPPADPNRFRTARTNFTRFIRSGGDDRASLGRAVSGYISRAAGGPRQAARSMGTSRTASTRFLSFLVNTAQRGVHESLRALNLEQFATRPIEEIFLGLSDYVCPEAGRDDEGIAKAAFIDTIAELAACGITDLGNLTVDQIQTLFELYATHTIELRIENEIGANSIILPTSVSEITNIQTQLHNFIQGAVEDALAAEWTRIESLTPDRIAAFVDNVYERAFTFLEAVGNQEDGSI